MKLLLTKPYKIFWLSIPILLAISIMGMNQTTDIQLHDTYFVIDVIHVGILFSVIAGLIGLLYWLFRNKRLVNWMTFSHVITTSLFLLLFMVNSVFNKSEWSDFNSYTFINRFHFFIILIVFLNQLLFLSNLVISLFRKIK